MSYYWDVCDKTIKLKSKSKQFKSNFHKEFANCQLIKISIENPSINNVDEIFYAYVIEHIKNYEYYLTKCEFILIFIDNQFCPYVTSELYSNKTMCYRYNFLENVFNDFKDKGYKFNHIAEMNIITIASKLDMSYDFYIKHNVHAVERKLILMINKDKTLVNKLNRNWTHHLIRNYSHVPFNN